MYVYKKTRVSLAPIDVTPNYRPSSCNSSFRQLVPALDPMHLCVKYDPVLMYSFGVMHKDRQTDMFTLSPLLPRGNSNKEKYTLFVIAISGFKLFSQKKIELHCHTSICFSVKTDPHTTYTELYMGANNIWRCFE